MKKNVIKRMSNNVTVKHAMHSRANKPRQRQQLMEYLGIDTSGFIALSAAMGIDLVGLADDGTLDLGEQRIINDGAINNPTLYRRWVMGQMFHMMNCRDGMAPCHNIHYYVQRKSARYIWEQLKEEFRIQAKMYSNGDMENYRVRHHWFNKTLIDTMVAHIHTLYDVNITERTFDCIADAYMTPDELYNNVCEIAERGKRYTKIAFPWWENAYIECGAYYTIQNLVLFHGCKYCDLSGEELMKSLTESLAESPYDDRVCMSSTMLNIIRENNFDYSSIERHTA